MKKESKYGEATKMVSFRVPESKVSEVVKIVKLKLNEYEKDVLTSRERQFSEVPIESDVKVVGEQKNVRVGFSEKKSNPTDDSIDVLAISFETIASLPFGTQLVDAFGTKGAIRKDAAENYYTKRTHNGKLEILKHENYACAVIYANENFK